MSARRFPVQGDLPGHDGAGVFSAGSVWWACWNWKMAEDDFARRAEAEAWLARCRAAGRWLGGGSGGHAAECGYSARRLADGSAAGARPGRRETVHAGDQGRQ